MPELAHATYLDLPSGGACLLPLFHRGVFPDVKDGVQPANVREPGPHRLLVRTTGLETLAPELVFLD